MAGSKVAELYVELAARGQGAVDQHLGQLQTNLKNVNKALTASQGEFKLMINQEERLAQAKQKLAKELDVAKYGKLGEALRTHVGALEQGLTKLTTTFSVMGAALAGTVSAASPEVFQTFTGSFQFLAAVIGEMVVPAMIDIIVLVQRLAYWIQDLDPGVKSFAVEVIKWGAIGSVVLFVASKFVMLAKAIWGAVAAARALAMTNPLTAALAIAGVVGGLALGNMAANAFAGGGPPDRQEQRDDAAQQRQNQLRAAASEAMANTPAARHQRVMASLSEQETAVARQQLSREEHARQMGNIHRLRQIQGEAPRGEAARQTPEHRAAVSAVAALQLPRQQHEAAMRAVEEGRALPAEQARRPRFQRGDTFQSQFMGIEQQWRRLQTAGASMSPLQQEIMRIRLATLRVLEESQGVQQAIAVNTAERSGPLSA